MKHYFLLPRHLSEEYKNTHMKRIYAFLYLWKDYLLFTTAKIRGKPSLLWVKWIKKIQCCIDTDTHIHTQWNDIQLLEKIKICNL